MADSRTDKLLILTGSYGAGHSQAANALKEAGSLYYPEAESIILDVTTLNPSLLETVNKRLFNAGVKRLPVLYHYFYQKTRSQNSLSKLLKDLTEKGSQRLYKHIREIQPQAIISTFPFAAGMVSRLKQKGYIHIPTVTVITDHSVHSSWIHEETDLYIVGSEMVQEQLVASGVPAKKIAVTGIPIHPKFSENYPEAYLKDKYNVRKNPPTLLITGGGLGLFKGVLPLLKELEELSQPVQVIVACGHNEQLKQKLEKFSRTSKHHLIIFGYVSFIDELMAISDLMITKPGGLTISEAIAMELPMIIYTTIGGQEQDNADFLLSSHLALFAKNHKEIVQQINEVLSKKSMLNDMNIQAKKMNYQKHSSKETIALITQLIAKDQYAIRLA